MSGFHCQWFLFDWLENDPRDSNVQPGLRTLGVWQMIYILFPIHNHIFCPLLVTFPRVCLCHLHIAKSIHSRDWAQVQLLLKLVSGPLLSISWSHMGGFHGIYRQIRLLQVLFVKRKPHSMKKCFSKYILWSISVLSHTITYVGEQLFFGQKIQIEKYYTPPVFCTSFSTFPSHP